MSFLSQKWHKKICDPETGHKFPILRKMNEVGVQKLRGACHRETEKKKKKADGRIVSHVHYTFLLILKTKFFQIFSNQRLESTQFCSFRQKITHPRTGSVQPKGRPKANKFRRVFFLLMNCWNSVVATNAKGSTFPLFTRATASHRGRLFNEIILVF